MSSFYGPLSQALEDYLGQGFSRLHMPGHKGRPLPVLGDAARWDVTEVEGTDSLYEAQGPIAACEAAFSRLYGTAATCLSAGGSTLCIQAMLALAAQRGTQIIAGRNIHTAAVNAMGLLGLEPLWVYPRREEGEGLIGRISPEDVEKALSRAQRPAAVYITSPDYFGVISDIAAIAGVCRRHGVPLLVDNAHGAHLKFLREGLHPMDLGADMCCDSLHKTLPALTGAALLHIGNPVFAPEAKRAMALFGSTSPSYLIMLSADGLLGPLANSLPEELRRTAARLEPLRALARRRGFGVPGGLSDPMRLTLDLSGSPFTGDTFHRFLREHSIQAEFVSDSGCVLLFSPANSPEDYGRTRRALLDVPPFPLKPRLFPVFFASQAMSLRQALLSPSEALEVCQAAGRIAAQTCAPCPPGIPLVMPGELLTEQGTKILGGYGIRRVNVVK